MIFFIDNLDSFNFNFIEIFKRLKIKTKIIKKYTKNKGIFFIAPGAGHPKKSKFSIKIIRHLYKHNPIVGICLGHQIINLSFHGKINLSKNISHAKKVKIFIKFKCLFLNNIPFKSYFCRYNSLKTFGINNFDKIMVDSYKENMFIIHKLFLIFGMQFHPESILSYFGIRLMKNLFFYIKNYD
ncbi:glutamine amidotransferase-related protein [Candidatus Vidania fulgoroideorum]